MSSTIRVDPNWRDEWQALLEHYAASDDSEQNMVIDIVNYLADKLNRAKQDARVYRTIATLAGNNQRVTDAHMSILEAEQHERKESGSKGGKGFKPYKEIDALALRLYQEKPGQTASSVADCVYDLAIADPEVFKFPADREVSYRTILDNLRKNIKSAQLPP